MIFTRERVIFTHQWVNFTHLRVIFNLHRVNLWFLPLKNTPHPIEERLEKANFWKPLATILVEAPSRLSLRRLRRD
jgi:hypothetical protein